MRIPTWAYVAGIWMILIGGCSMFSDYNDLNIREIKESTKGVMEDFSKRIESENDSTKIAKIDSVMAAFGSKKDTTKNRSLSETMASMVDFSEEVIELTIAFAKAGLIIYLIYIIAGILLMVRTRISIPMAIFMLIVSIAFVFIQSMYIVKEMDGMMANFAKWSYYIGILFDIIILIIILAGDKSYYKFLPDEEE